MTHHHSRNVDPRTIKMPLPQFRYRIPVRPNKVTVVASVLVLLGCQQSKPETELIQQIDRGLEMFRQLVFADDFANTKADLFLPAKQIARATRRQPREIAQRPRPVYPARAKV